MNHRHGLNMYTAVAMSAIISRPSSSNDDMRSTVYGALKTAILNHPSLALLIHGDSTNAPEFRMADQVDMAQMVTWCNDNSTQNEEQALVTKYLGRKFENIDEIPPWRVVVCARGREALSVTFVFNHTIGDGTSGRIFLNDLAKALNTASPVAEGSTVVKVPKEMEIPPSLEMVSKLRLGFFYLVSEFAKLFGVVNPAQGVWAGTSTIASAEEFTPPVDVQVARLSLDAALVQKLASECQARKLSMSGLISALAVVALDTVIPDASTGANTKISAALPRNLRPALAGSGVGANDMGLFVSSIDTILARSKVRSSGTTDGARVWATAAQLTQVIRDNIALKDWNTSVGLLRYVPNMRSYLQSLIGKPATTSLDISTLLVDPSTSTSVTDKWTLKEFSFTQSPNLFSSAFILNSIGYKGDKLNVTFVWAKEVLDNELAAKIVDQFKKSVEELGQSI